MKPLISVILSGLAIAASAAPVAVNPYTFLGRVMDSRHAGFDANRVATLKASRKSGELLASTTTYFRADSRRNYTLMIQMASEPADSYAVKGEPLDISVVDNAGNTWEGVIVDAAAQAPDAVREVDIVLGRDENGDGIDDDLYGQLEARWERSDYCLDGETFDPHKDHDGDGVSTIDEALSGTNPFDPDDVLKITAFTTGEKTSLSFVGVGGYSYTVEESSSLGGGSGWSAVNVVSMPGNSNSATNTVYLLPSSPTSSFFRVKAK